MERRRYARVYTFLSASFSSQNSNRYFGTITNLSYNGLFIQTHLTFLNIGDKITITIKVKQEEINVVGVIRRKKIVDKIALVSYGRSGLGVEVEYMPPQLTDYINEKLTFIYDKRFAKA